ncbi:MAG: NAD(P)/FAD-dependent oxidoreductase [Bacteroidia bacterium]|nr:NAD(P)/FAD-dependent oxidoreductase [Bacteroidia bacterium]
MEFPQVISANSVTRRSFILQSSILLASLAIPKNTKGLLQYNTMIEKNMFDVIIIGGSYSGLAAGLALGRALRKVLIIDSGMPCNRQTPHSHNFITHDGKTPAEITSMARQQVKKYDTVTFLESRVVDGTKVGKGFEIKTEKGEVFNAKKLIFATGIRDQMPDIEGFSECWGITAIHCPYCHGYEVRNQTTGILANGALAYEFSMLISNWTQNLTVYTNGKSTLTDEQIQKLQKHSIKVVETEIRRLEHTKGYMRSLVFKDGAETPLQALYSKRPFTQHSSVPEKMGCEMNDEGYIRTNSFQKTTIDGIFACGDNSTRMRTVANAVAMGTTAGMMANKELIEESF